MEFELKVKLEDSRENLGKALVGYASARLGKYETEFELFTKGERKRDPIGLKLVGQFLDQNAQLDEQFGIYGMADWLCLTCEDSVRENGDVKILRENCAKKLIDWTVKFKNQPIPDKEEERKYIKELRETIPKICITIKGLSCHSFDDSTMDEARIEAIKELKSRIQSSATEVDANTVYWTFSTSKLNNDQNIEMQVLATSYVISTLSDESEINFKRLISKGIKYLHCKRVNRGVSLDSFKDLYLLNLLQTFDGYNYRDEIKKSLHKLFKSIFINPSKFVNPINIDFLDGSRTRYLRIQSDLIILDSLMLISEKNLHYVHGNIIGFRILNNIIKNLEHPWFNKDTSYHHAATSTYITISKLLNRLIETSIDQEIYKISIFGNLFARIKCARLFGVRFMTEMILLASTLMLLILMSPVDNALITKSIWFNALTSGLFAAIFSAMFRIGIYFYKFSPNSDDNI